MPYLAWEFGMEVQTAPENQSDRMINFKNSDTRTPLPEQRNNITTSKTYEVRTAIQNQIANIKKFKSSEVRTILPDKCSKAASSKSSEAKSKTTTKPKKKPTSSKGAKVIFILPKIEPLEKSLQFLEDEKEIKQEVDFEVQPSLKKRKDKISTSKKSKAEPTAQNQFLALFDSPELLESSARIEGEVHIVEEPEYFFVGHMEVEAVKKLEMVKISADDVPQTNWSCYRCREWIAAYLISNLAFKTHGQYLLSYSTS
jgi:hypothetical protein